MNHFNTLTVLLLTAVVQNVYCLPELLPRTTCAPRLITTTYLTTISKVQTVPHSCYTRTVTTVQSSFPCSGTTTFDPKTCGPIPLCILLSTTTITVPPSDTCCPQTPTVTVPGSCASCQRGCATQTDTTTVTINPLTRRQNAAAEITPCTTTLNSFKIFNLDPTETIFPSTVTETESVDCAGCSLRVRRIGGIGPVVRITTTEYAPGPTTTTEFACAPSMMVG